MSKSEGPEVVVLIGSTRFKDEYEEATRRLTMEGKIVVSVGLFGHKEGLDMGGHDKSFLDALHMTKIMKGDSVYLINPGGYVGESTRRELFFAGLTGKRVDSIEPLPAWFTDRVDGYLHTNV